LEERRIEMASTQKQIFAVIKSLTGQNNILTIPRSLIDYTGDKETALFLSQLIYWSDKGHDEDWIYKTNQEWKDEIHITRYALEKARKILEQKGILECKIKKVYSRNNTAVHYKIDIEKFVESYIEFTEKEQQTSMDAGNAENNIPGMLKRTFRECRNQQSGNAEKSIPSNTKITITKITAYSDKNKGKEKTEPGKYEKFYL
jgi:hypothetical protein